MELTSGKVLLKNVYFHMAPELTRLLNLRSHNIKEEETQFQIAFIARPNSKEEGCEPDFTDF